MRAGRVRYGRRHCRTGLRNRSRGGRGTYCRERKARTADVYGSFIAGRRTSPDRIG